MQLCPADTSIVEYHQRILLEAKQLARKLSIVCVSDKANEKDKENDSDAKINLVSIKFGSIFLKDSLSIIFTSSFSC